MKKFVYLILCLSIIGAVLSGILLLQHFYPEANLGLISCSRGLINPCTVLNQSSWSTVLTIPVAAYGLLFYLMVLFILLIADYAAERYYLYSLAVILPLSGLAVLGDIALGIFLIKSQLFCTYCVATYAVNVCILVSALFWYKLTVANQQVTLMGTIRDLLTLKEASSDKKAFASSFILFAFLLTFAIFSTSYILRLKTESAKVPEDKVNSFITNFYGTPIENINFPAGGIMLGNPNAELTVYSFTDFLCSACYKYYQIEKYLLSKYKDRIKFIYYNYPLDKDCNSYMQKTIYKNSCVAARAMLAVNKTGFIEPYIVKHFIDYDQMHTKYDMSTALTKLNLVESDLHKGLSTTAFATIMESPETKKVLNDHIEFAKKFKIDATPTIFINKRRIVGVPPVEILDALIQRELSAKKS